MVQAKFFLRNAKKPSHVFALECSKDVCQERMVQEIGETGKGYLPSAILSKKIKEYHTQAKQLLPYLRGNTNFFCVNAERPWEKVMEDINKEVEPCVIHIRPGANSNDLRKQITEQLAA